MSCLANMGGRPAARLTNEDNKEDVQAVPKMDLPSGAAEPGRHEYAALRGKALWHVPGPVVDVDIASRSPADWIRASDGEEPGPSASII